MKIIILVSLSILFVSCGKEAMPWEQSIQVQSVKPAEPVDYSYELQSQKCTTGKHEFDTLIEVCEALKNNDLNNDCALEEREKLFSTSCPGSF